jgi:hypothetical protein
MPVVRPDLILLRQGHPVVVVEVKGRLIPPHLRPVVLEQLRYYSRTVTSDWSILIDPLSAQIYSSGSISEPLAVIPTSRILHATGLDHVTTVGSAVLALAARRWLQQLAEHSDRDDDTIPRAFLEALHGVDEFIDEFAVA